jgi:hypothetical protein
VKNSYDLTEYDGFSWIYASFRLYASFQADGEKGQQCSTSLMIKTTTGLSSPSWPVLTALVSICPFIGEKQQLHSGTFPTGFVQDPNVTINMTST